MRQGEKCAPSWAMRLNTKRRDGFYEITYGNTYWQVERVGREWKRRQWYGPILGWGIATMHPTLRDAKESIVDEGWG
jgi:hypothetical protein